MQSALLKLVVLLTMTVTNCYMIGGFIEQNPSDPIYMEMAWKAARMVNDEASNVESYEMVPIKVIKAKSQVVSGIKFVLDVLYGESSCRKEDIPSTNLNTVNCPLKPNGDRALYEVELWEQPWRDFQQFNVKKLRNVAAGEII